MTPGDFDKNFKPPERELEATERQGDFDISSFEDPIEQGLCYLDRHMTPEINKKIKEFTDENTYKKYLNGDNEAFLKVIFAINDHDPNLLDRFVSENLNRLNPDSLFGSESWLGSNLPKLFGILSTLNKDTNKYKALLEKHLDYTIESEPTSIIFAEFEGYTDVYKDHENYPIVLEKALRSQLKIYPDELLKYAIELMDKKPYGPELFDEIIATSSDEQICYLLSAKHPDAERIFTEIITKKPGLAPILFMNNSSFVMPRPVAKEQPYGKPLLNLALSQWVRKDPVAFMDAFLIEAPGFHENKFHLETLYEVLGQEQIDHFKETAIKRVVKEDPIYFMETLLGGPDVERLFERQGRNWLARKAIEDIVDVDVFYFWGVIAEDPITKKVFDRKDFKELKKRAIEKRKIVQESTGRSSEKIDKKNLPLTEENFKPYLIGIKRTLTIPLPEFENILFSTSFQAFLQKQAGKITYMNAVSLTQTVYRKLQAEELPLSEENIESSVDAIFAQWERVSQRELFGPNTKLILFTHEEKRFKNNQILKNLYYRSGGKEENILASEKGVKMEEGKNVYKTKILEAIAGSKKGMATIVFYGHGSSNVWAFSANQANNENNSLNEDPNGITYKELGDAMIASGNIENFNLAGATCHSYDYEKNLMNYLEEEGVKEKPYVALASANEDRFSYSFAKTKRMGKKLNSQFLQALYDFSEEGEPTTVQQFFDAEGAMWQHSDPALFVGLPEEEGVKSEEDDKDFDEILEIAEKKKKHYEEIAVRELREAKEQLT